MFGGKIEYTWFAPGYAFGGEGGMFNQEDKDATMQYQMLFMEYYPTAQLAVSLKLFNRRTSIDVCHDDAATCLREGKVMTTIEEKGALLGAGVVFFCPASEST